MGKGATASVHVGNCTATGRQVALKTIDSDVLDRKDAKCTGDARRLAFEILSSHRLRGATGIVQLLDVILSDNGSSAPTCTLVLEKMDGDLTRLIRKPPAGVEVRSLVRKMLVGVLEGLVLLHARGVMHRDIKAHNILYRRCGSDGNFEFKLGDLGSAYNHCGGDEPNTSYVMTRWYRSPEVLEAIVAHERSSSNAATTPAPATRSRPKYDKSIDLWSLGCVLLEMLLRSPPFKGSSSKETLENVSRDHPVLLRDGGPVWKAADSMGDMVLYDLAKQLLAWNPRDRPTAKEALKTLVGANELESFERRKLTSSASTQPIHRVPFREHDTIKDIIEWIRWFANEAKYNLKGVSSRHKSDPIDDEPKVVGQRRRIC